MSVTLTISDKTYKKLQSSAKAKQKNSVEEMLDEWDDNSEPVSKEEVLRRKMLGEKISRLQKRLSQKYGTMTDSADLVREDRDR